MFSPQLFVGPAVADTAERILRTTVWTDIIVSVVGAANRLGFSEQHVNGKGTGGFFSMAAGNIFAFTLPPGTELWTRGTTRNDLKALILPNRGPDDK